ncbi:MAG: LacI family DNA-binding transcriptional regulator [Actinomycetota bacterium]
MTADAPDPLAGPVTIVDVAREAGVSHSTVSRVLNGRPHIKAETKDRVLDALDRLGYVANLKARGLAGGRTGVVGLVVLHLESSYITSVVRGVDAALAEQGYDLMLCTTHHREQREASYVSRLSLGLVDGLIVLLPHHSDRYAQDLASRGFPFVLLDHRGDSSANSIMSENVPGVRASLEHLAELGHRRIAMITGELDTDAGRDRLRGFREVTAELDLDQDPSLIVEGDFLAERARFATRELLALDQPPTAVLASADTAALAVIDELAAHGLRVPDDVSVVGFDDIPEAATARPPLTTVRQPLTAMGRRAVQVLLDVIDDPDQPVAHAELATELIVRDSTAPPPG